jgi:nucleoside-diphosphate-sugar epimerase
MKSCLVIGANGFLGSNMVAYLNKAGFTVDVADRDTPRQELAKTNFELVINCAGNSKTWLAERDPVKCLQENVIDLIGDLNFLHFGMWVQISSNTVYTSEDTQEDGHILATDLSTYAYHKLLGEHYTRKLANNWLILRPTGFFGPGLKKNLLFDLRANSSEIYFTRDSYIDFIPVALFCEMVVSLAESAIGEIVNVGSDAALPVGDLIDAFPSITVAEDARHVDNRSLNLTKLKHHYSILPSADEIRNQVMAFLQEK